MKQNKITYELLGKTLIYYMPKEVDHHVAQHLCMEIDRLIEAYAIVNLVLDFAATDFMDSSGIGVVIGRSKVMRFREGTIEAVHLRERVAGIFRAAALQKIVQIKEV